MLYNVPKTAFGPDLMLHKFQTMAETNALGQARRSRVFPVSRKINTTIRLKDGRTLQPNRASGMSGLSAAPRLDYHSKSSPYLSGQRRRARPGMGDISDFFSGIKNTITGTVSTVTGTVAGVANAAQPLEQILQNNPSLLSLVKSYLPGPSTISNPNIVVAQSPPKVTAGATLGVSNKVWLVGGLGMGAIAALKLLGKH